ncbi:M6 family metalloprotease domain-containing protein [Streptomyces sp. NPDC004959]|uniref:M6 family metalloprotease domain-containing protein n=1 Tax=unclassified Streptomyces TaxID=2593676 RepID=UPI0033A14144
MEQPTNGAPSPSDPIPGRGGRDSRKHTPDDPHPAPGRAHTRPTARSDAARAATPPTPASASSTSSATSAPSAASAGPPASTAPSSRLRRAARLRRGIAVASLAPLAVAVTLSTTGSGSPDAAGHSAPGPVAAGGGDGVDACRITGPLGTQMSEGLPTTAGYTRSTGRVRALNLLVDFSDARGEGSVDDRLGEFFPQTTRWFERSSYGRLDYRPETPVKRWLRMPKPFSAYGIERGAPFEPGYRQLVRDLVKISDPLVDFAAYDLVNVLVTPNAGPSALDTVLSVTFAGNREAPVADGVPLANTSFLYSRQDDGSGSYPRTGYRVLPHENGHVFGLPDLYTQDGGGAVGHWDIMSEDWGANNDLLGWHKWKLGWLDDNQVGCVASPGTYDFTVAPLAAAGHGRKLLFVPLSRTSGIAAEVRTRGGNDDSVCKPGVLVYRVDADVDTGQGPITVADSKERSGGCTRTPNVHAELSDAPFGVGETYRDDGSRTRVEVLGKTENGDYRIRVHKD